MANELTMNHYLAFVKGNRKVNLGENGVNVSVNGTDFVHRTQAIGSTEETLNYGEITTPGYSIFRNNDATDTVNLRPNTGDANMCALPPGAYAGPFKLAVSTAYGISSANTPELEYVIIEE